MGIDNFGHGIHSLSPVTETIVKLVCSELSLSCRFVSSRDGVFGNLVNNSNIWTGFINDTIEGVVDFTAPYLIALPERINALQFIQSAQCYNPWPRCLLVDRKMARSLNRLNWWVTFTDEVWFCLSLLRFIHFLTPMVLSAAYSTSYHTFSSRKLYSFLLILPAIAIDYCGMVFSNDLYMHKIEREALPFDNLNEALSKNFAKEFKILLLKRFLNAADSAIMRNKLLKMALNPDEILFSPEYFVIAENGRSFRNSILGDNSNIALVDCARAEKLIAGYESSFLVLKVPFFESDRKVSFISSKLEQNVRSRIAKIYQSLCTSGILPKIAKQYHVLHTKLNKIEDWSHIGETFNNNQVALSLQQFASICYILIGGLTTAILLLTTEICFPTLVMLATIKLWHSK